LRLFHVCNQLLVIALLSACTAPASVMQRMSSADLLAEAHGWQRVSLVNEPLPVVAYLNPGWRRVSQLAVYIEGDGFAWASSDTPSDNPTPNRPIALMLALRDGMNGAVYLARPCQFVAAIEATRCDVAHWTRERFSGEIVAVMQQALDELKRLGAAQDIHLIGYSGGAAIALLMAAQRTDVSKVTTVAGNLDIEAWTRHHRVSPLQGSLNPADFSSRLGTLNQLHFVGSKDRIVPPGIAQSYAARFPHAQRPRVIVIDGFDHECCWVERWPQLSTSAP